MLRTTFRTMTARRLRRIFGSIYVDMGLGLNRMAFEDGILPCPFISIKNAATATLPVGMARLKKKTVTQVYSRKLRSSPVFTMTEI